MDRRSAVPPSPATWRLPCLIAAAAAGCITINLYFPVAELENAAKEIVRDARPEEVQIPAPPPGEGGGNGAEGAGEPGAAPPGAPPVESPPLPVETPPPPAESSPPPIETPPPAEPAPGEKEASREPRGFGTSIGAVLINFSLPAAHAAEPEEAIKLDISTPLIKRIREALKKRYPSLVRFYATGAIGEGKDGYVAFRDTEGLSLKEKRDLQVLVKEENENRMDLYLALARENGIDESRVPDIGVLFSAEWQKASKTGWWIEPEKGKWTRKPEEKKKEKGA